MTLLADACRVSRRAAWAGVGAPKNTPAEIIDTLNREINAALVDPTIKARFADLSGEVLALSPTEYRKRIAEETEKWAKVIEFSNAKPDLIWAIPAQVSVMSVP
jgi:tripartite-type tricarboxylate transporter receptor subunit TctC